MTPILQSQIQMTWGNIYGPTDIIDPNVVDSLTFCPDLPSLCEVDVAKLKVLLSFLATKLIVVNVLLWME